MTATTFLILCIVALVGLVVYLAHAGKLAALEAKIEADATHIWNAISDHDSVLSAHDDAITDLSDPAPTAAPVTGQTDSASTATASKASAGADSQTDPVAAQAAAGSSVQS